MLVSLMSSVVGVWVSSGRQSTHSPPCEQLLAAVGVGAGCLRRRAPSIVIWGCRGPCPVRRTHRPPLSSSPCPPSSRHPARALVGPPSFSLSLASPIVLGLFVWVSSSPPHCPHCLLSSCCCSSSSSLSVFPYHFRLPSLLSFLFPLLVRYPPCEQRLAAVAWVCRLAVISLSPHSCFLSLPHQPLRCPRGCWHRPHCPHCPECCLHRSHGGGGSCCELKPITKLEKQFMNKEKLTWCPSDNKHCLGPVLFTLCHLPVLAVD